MAFLDWWRQLNLLLWKNILLRTRKKVILMRHVHFIFSLIILIV